MSDFPFPGLRPFKHDETDIFFGRDELSNQLIERLGNTHFIAVVGLSGCGKSSLVRTGLLAGLEMGLLASAGIHWRVAELRPGNRPFARLAEALLTDDALKKEYAPQSVESTHALSQLIAALKRGPLSLYEILQESPLPSNTNLLLVVDQFEELFRHYQQGNVDDSAAFVRLLLESSQHAAVYIVITLRSEFIGDCALFHGLPEAINAGLFLTPRLTREQLRIAIEGPAKVFDGQLAPQLTNLLLNEMSSPPDEKGNTPDRLPVLQHALMRMWDIAQAENIQQPTLTLKHYQQIGGLDNALSQHADEAYEEALKLVVPAEPKKIIELLFRRLCERDPARRDTRSPVTLEEIAKLANVPSWQQIVPIIEVFRQTGSYFLTPPQEIILKPESIIDISHESFIHHWKRSRDWSEKEAKSAEIYRRLEATAILKEEGKAELWKGLDLANVSDVFKEEKPTQIWAKRYGKNKGQYFELAMRFLKESENKQKQKQRRKEELERREKEQQRLRLKQMRKIAVGAITGLLVMVGLSIWVFIERNHAVKQEQIAISEKQNAEQAKLDSQLNNAAWLGRFDDYKTAQTVLGKIKESHQDIPTSRRHAYNLLNWFNKLMGSDSEYIYKGAEVALSAIAINNKHLAVAGENGTVALFDIKTGKLLQRLQGHEGHVKTVVFHPQGEWLASAGYDKRIIRWSLPTSKQIQSEWQTPDKVWTLAVSPDGNYLASGGKDNDITLWDVKTGSKRIFTGHEDDVKGLAFSFNGKLLASASYDGTVRLWDIATGEKLHKLVGHTNKVYTVAFSHDDKWLASGSKDTTVRLWEVDSGKPKHLLLGHEKSVFGVSFSADGRYVVSASDDMTLRMWDTEYGVTMRVLQGHTAGINGVVISAGKIFSVSDDATVRRWNTTLPYQQAIDFSKTPLATAIAPDGNRVAVGFKDGTLRLYDLPETRLLWEQQTAHTKALRRIAFNSDGSLLASASADKTAKLWQAKDGTLIQTFTGHKDVVNAVTFAPNNILVTASFDGQFGSFIIDTKQKAFYTAHDGKDVNSIVFASTDFFDASTELLSTGENDVRLWNFSILLKKYAKATGLIWSALSPNGEQIASVGRDQLVHVYSINDSITYRLKGHENTIYRVIFSPTGQQIATVSSDATLRLWDLRHGMELFSLRLPTNSGKPVPLKDFDFRCVPEGDNCWIAVPLIRGKLMLYKLENIYDNAQ